MSAEAEAARIIRRLEDENETLLAMKDRGYIERTKCVAALAALALRLGWTAGMGQHDPNDADWESDWRNIVFIELPTGQVSWHIHDSELPAFWFLGRYAGTWDGHDTTEKYARLAMLSEPAKKSAEVAR